MPKAPEMSTTTSLPKDEWVAVKPFFITVEEDDFAEPEEDADGNLKKKYQLHWGWITLPPPEGPKEPEKIKYCRSSNFIASPGAEWNEKNKCCQIVRAMGVKIEETVREKFPGWFILDEDELEDFKEIVKGKTIEVLIDHKEKDGKVYARAVKFRPLKGKGTNVTKTVAKTASKKGNDQMERKSPKVAAVAAPF